MIVTHRSYRGYDRPIHIEFLQTFINVLFDELYLGCERLHFRLFDDSGNLIGRSASYDGVSYDRFF